MYEPHTFCRVPKPEAAFCHIADGREICVVYEWIDVITIFPISAFEVDH